MGKKTIGFLAILVIVLLALNIFQFYYFNYMRPSVPAEDVPIQITELKGPNWQGYIGKRATIEGFFAEASPNLFLLVSSLDYLAINAPIPNEKFVRISGTLPEDLLANSGARMYIKGVVRSANGDELSLLEYNSFMVVQLAAKPWREYLVSIAIGTILGRSIDYAVLISGGWDSGNAHLRYWNDLKCMYSILINRYYYKPRNIYVIYKDGVAADTEMPVNYSASLTNVQTVFTQLAEKMNTKDNLFIYTTNHGSPTGLCLYNHQEITPSQFRTELNKLTGKYNRITIVMEQCYSGNFIPQLSGTNIVIMTACSSTQYSYGCDSEGGGTCAYDEFVYHFMSAVNFQTPYGTAVNADTNADGYVSMVEAFNYALSHDSAPENPYYDDNGNGIGYNAVMPSGGDGSIGSNTYL
jgi:hypothetical protein